MTNEELIKIIGNIPIYEDEHHSIREYQDAKIITMAMIKNYNKLKTEYIKLKEAVGKIKAEISNDISSLGSTHETMTVGLKDALDTINLYTEGLI